jgi:hypothetical protein
VLQSKRLMYFSFFFTIGGDHHQHGGGNNNEWAIRSQQLGQSEHKVSAFCTFNNSMSIEYSSQRRSWQKLTV